MLSGDPIIAARKLLSGEVSAQHQRLLEDIAKLLREHEARGALKSNDTLMEGTLLCCAMLQDRVAIFSKVLETVVAGSGAAQGSLSAVELKGLVEEFLRPRDPFVLEQLSGLISAAEASNVIDKLADKVEKARKHVLMRLGVEIDLLCRRTGSEGFSFWRSRFFLRGLIFAEIVFVTATLWYAVAMFSNPVANAEIPLLLTGILTFLLNWLRRSVAASQ